MNRLQMPVPVKPGSEATVNVAVLIRGDQRWTILFTDDNQVAALRQLGRWAANPELSFTWTDAAQLGTRIIAMGGGT